MTEELEAVLACQGRGEHSAEAAQRAFLTVDDEIATHCPAYAEAEFGGAP